MEAFLRALTNRATASAATRRVLKTSPTRPVRRAAVLCPLTVVDGQLHLLFTVRTGQVSTHKGQVSFPGGHLDGGETATEAALRETLEELGSEARAVAVAEHHDVIAITGTYVTPVLGLMTTEDLSLLQPNPSEVARLFSLSLQHLTDPANSMLQFIPKRFDEKTGKQVPRTGIHLPQFPNAPQPVWGLTAFILAALLDDVILPACKDVIDNADATPSAHPAEHLSQRPPFSSVALDAFVLPRYRLGLMEAATAATTGVSSR